MFNTSLARPKADSGPSQAPSTSRDLLDTSGDGAPFLSAPVEVRQLIYKCLSYDDLSKARLVCRTMNTEAWNALNKGFKEFNAQLERERHQLKRELPRRESDRRKHKLFPYSEIVASLETRRDLLDITYRKYMDKDVTCFIPGKVLDEGFRLLRFIRANKGNGEPMHYELLKDFRDLSSMAIDHFEESIAPSLRKKTDTLFSSFLSLRRSNLFSNLSSGQSLLNKLMSNKTDVKRMGANYLQQRLAEQDATIKKQNQKIEHLRAATGLLISAVEQLSDYVGLSIPTTPLREILMADEAPVPGEDHPGGSNDTLEVLFGGNGALGRLFDVGGDHGDAEAAPDQPSGSNNEPPVARDADSRKRKLDPHPEDGDRKKPFRR